LAYPHPIRRTSLRLAKSATSHERSDRRSTAVDRGCFFVLLHSRHLSPRRTRRHGGVGCRLSRWSRRPLGMCRSHGAMCHLASILDHPSAAEVLFPQQQFRVDTHRETHGGFLQTSSPKVKNPPAVVGRCLPLLATVANPIMWLTEPTTRRLIFHNTLANPPKIKPDRLSGNAADRRPPR